MFEQNAVKTILLASIGWSVILVIKGYILNVSSSNFSFVESSHSKDWLFYGENDTFSSIIS